MESGENVNGEALDNSKGIDTGILTDCGLRYDLTLPLSRYYANNANELGSPFKALQMGNVWDLIRELFNPTVLYATSGGWFMENDLCLSFAGNEFAVLFCSGTAAVCLMAVGKRRYHQLEV